MSKTNYKKSKTIHDNHTTITTGFPELDTNIELLRPGQVSVIASRPGVGKSTIANRIMKHLRDTNQPHAIMIENPDSILTLLSDDFAALVDKLDVKIIILDYLQLCNVNIPDDETESTNSIPPSLEISDDTRKLIMQYVMQTLKEIASKYNISILALSQLSSAVDSRYGHIPMMDDLSEPIRNLADNVVLLSRNSYYSIRDNETAKTPEEQIRDITFYIAKDNGKIIDKTGTGTSNDAMLLYNFVQKVMKIPAYTISHGIPNLFAYRICSQDCELLFFENIRDFQSTEVHIACGDVVPFENPRYDTLYTMHVKIANHTWTLQVGGLGPLLNDGNIMDCSNNTIEELTKIFDDIHAYYLTVKYPDKM